MDVLQKKIDELLAKIGELKSGDRTLENAQKLRDARAELATARDELATAEAEQAEVDAAFADDDADKAVDPQAADGPKEGESQPGRRADEVLTPDPEKDSTKPAEGEDAEDDAADADAAATTGPVALAASGADRSGASAMSAQANQTMTLVASGAAGAAGIKPGASLDRNSLAEVLTAAGMAAGGVASRTRVVSIERFGPDADFVSHANSTIENTRRIAKARADFMAAKGDGSHRPVSLTAAGCFCGPDELIRQTGVVGRRGRPFAAMFPTIPISGGFRAMPDLAFNVDTGLRAGVSQWTCTDQGLVDAEDSSTWKPCAEITCFTEDTYEPYAVEACVTVERFHRWAHPEQVDAWINLLGIEYDALAETLLIDQIEAEAGTPLTIGAAGNDMADFSMVAKLVVALGSMAYPLGYQYREGAGVLSGYTLSVPVGMSEALWADERLRGFPSQLGSAQEILSMIQAATGVRIVERLDESTSRKSAAAATVTALNSGGAIDPASHATPLLPPTFRLYLIPTEGYVHGEGTIVAADWHVDDTLLRTNRMRYFLENAEILVNLSVRKPFILDVPGEILGSYTDLTTAPGH